MEQPQPILVRGRCSCGKRYRIRNARAGITVMCPNCRRLISADEPRCPYCGTSAPGSLWRNNPIAKSFFHPDVLVK